MRHVPASSVAFGMFDHAAVIGGPRRTIRAVLLLPEDLKAASGTSPDAEVRPLTVHHRGVIQCAVRVPRAELRT
jgi:hypothetical protein